MKTEWQNKGEFFVMKKFKSLKDEYLNDFKVSAILKRKGRVSPKVCFGGVSFTIKEWNSSNW